MVDTILPEPTIGKFDLTKATTATPMTAYTPTPVTLAGEQSKEAAKAQKFAWAPDQATQALNIDKERRAAEATRAYKTQQNQQVEATKAEIARIEALIAAENSKIGTLQGAISGLDSQIVSLNSQIQTVKNTVASAPPPPPAANQPAAPTTSGSASPVVSGVAGGAAWTNEKPSISSMPEYQRQMAMVTNAQAMGIQSLIDEKTREKDAFVRQMQAQGFSM